MSDLIRREDAIEQLNEAISAWPPCMKGTGIYRTSALEEAIDIINSIPSADRPKGHWIKQGISPYEGIQRCSICKDIYDITEDFNFCPNCGAEMRGESDE